MEDALRALQQQVSALQSQDGALGTQLRSPLRIAQIHVELPGENTTVLNRAQAPTGRMLVDQKDLGKPPVFSGKEEDFHLWAKNVEKCVSGVFPNVPGALSFAVSHKMWSQQQRLRSACLNLTLKRLQRCADNSS